MYAQLKVKSINGKEFNITIRSIGNGRISIESNETDFCVGCNEEDEEREIALYVAELESGICDN